MSDWKVTYDYITSTDSLDRQRMLALTGTVLAGSVAGCSGGADEETAAGDTDGSGDDDSDDGSEATDASETEESRPDVVVVEEEMTDDTYTDTEYAKIVEFEVENQGDGRSGPVDIAVDWFDSNGEKTGDERRDIPFLPADTTWASFVPSIYEFDTPDSYELELEVDTELEEQPEVGVVYALDADSGEEQWRFGSLGACQTSPTVADGTVYVGANDGSVYALDAETGEKQWSHETYDEVKASMSIAGGTLYVVPQGDTMWGRTPRPASDCGGPGTTSPISHRRLSTDPRSSWRTTVLRRSTARTARNAGSSNLRTAHGRPRPSSTTRHSSGATMASCTLYRTSDPRCNL
jgi:hypothetical protein